MADQEPMNRRRFFRDGLRQLLEPMVRGIADPIERAAREFNQSLQRSEKRPGNNDPRTEVLPTLWLRPPGALAEKHFLATCTRAGDCVKACPVQAIRLDTAGQLGRGAAYIVADAQACAMCADLACMKACRSGALTPVSREDIDMGLAVWKSQACLRSSGEECRLCEQACPVGPQAIEIRQREVVIHPAACTGCGMCQQACPTQPRAVQVIPRAAREL